MALEWSDAGRCAANVATNGGQSSRARAQAAVLEHSGQTRGMESSVRRGRGPHQHRRFGGPSGVLTQPIPEVAADIRRWTTKSTSGATTLRSAGRIARPANCVQRLGLTPRSRAGRKRIAFRSANTAATVMPIKRNGRQINQMIGYSTSTATASGHENTNNKHQATSAKKRRMAYV